VDGIEVSKTGYLCILLDAEVDGDKRSTPGYVKGMRHEESVTIWTNPIKKACHFNDKSIGYLCILLDDKLDVGKRNTQE
jgi:hypothetical protein